MAFSFLSDHLLAMAKKSNADPDALDPPRRALWNAATAAGVDWANLSKQIGRNHAYLRQYLWRRSPAKLDEEDREKLAKILRVSVDALRTGVKPAGEQGEANQPQRDVVNRNDSGVEFLGSDGARRFQGPKNLPIFGHVKAGADGHFYGQGDFQGYKMRPEALLHVPTAYAVRVHDMSMFPAYEPNDLVDVNPTLAVVPDSNVVIQLIDGQAFVKRLVRRTEKHVICLEWHPEKREIRYDRKQVQFIHMIERPR